MVELVGCPETSTRIYYYALRNNPEELSYVAVLPLSGNTVSWLSNPQTEEISGCSYYWSYPGFIVCSQFCLECDTVG
jgi:hypothetical protein